MTSIRLMRATAGCLAVAAVLVAGCSDEQKRDVEGAAARAVMADEVEDAVEDAGFEIDDEDLDCEVDIRDDATVVGTCTGTTESGEDVAADLTGTANIDQASCTSSLTVSVAGEQVGTRSNFDCLDD